MKIKSVPPPIIPRNNLQLTLSPCEQDLLWDFAEYYRYNSKSFNRKREAAAKRLMGALEQVYSGVRSFEVEVDIAFSEH